VSSAPRDHGVRALIRAMSVPEATRFAALAGLGLGALSGGVYWLAVQLWPSSVAVMLSILAGALLSNDMRQAATVTRLDVFSQLFYVLIKYNVLMALSAANLPFAAPPNTALWLIMICGCGASRSLLVCVINSRSAPPPAPLQAAPMQAAPLSHVDLALVLLIGFAPAALLGLPGLIGLAAAVLCVIALMRARGSASLAMWTAELCFYLGAQASWSYV
jgi:cobalamin synthase